MRKLLVLLTVGLSLAGAAPCAAQGVLRVALGTTLSQLDPAKTTIGDEYVYVHLVFNGLSRIDPDMTVSPISPKAGLRPTIWRPGRSSCARASSSTTAACSTPGTWSPR